MQKPFIAIAALALSGCAVTSAGLAKTDVERTFESEKSPRVLATCVAENTPGDVELRDDGTRYWVIINVMGLPRGRYDFIPNGSGTTVELRGTGVAGVAKGPVEKCL